MMPIMQTHEPPADEDAYYVDSIADSELSSLLLWENYLNRLRNGAWGDHIAIQGIANMLKITINVLSSQSPTITQYGSTVYIGMAMGGSVL